MRIAFLTRRFGLGSKPRLLAAAFVAALAARPLPANALALMLDSRVAEATAKGDVAGAAAIIDTALAAETDPAIVEDLLRRKAVLLLSLIHI